MPMPIATKTLITAENLLAKGFHKYQSPTEKTNQFYSCSYEKPYRLENGQKYHIHINQYDISYPQERFKFFNGTKFNATIQVEIFVKNENDLLVSQTVDFKFSIDKDSSLEILEHMAEEYVKVFPLT